MTLNNLYTLTSRVRTATSYRSIVTIDKTRSSMLTLMHIGDPHIPFPIGHRVSLGQSSLRWMRDGALR